MIIGTASSTAHTPSDPAPGSSGPAGNERPARAAGQQDVPGLAPPRSKRSGTAAAAPRPRRAAAPQVPAQAATTAPAGPSFVRRPAMDPKYHEDLLRRMAQYRGVNDGLQQHLADGTLDLPPHSRRELDALQETIRDIESMVPYLLEGKSPPYSGEFMAEVTLTRYVQLELKARMSVRELVLEHPRHVVPLLGDINAASYVSHDLATVLHQAHSMFEQSAPQVCGYVEDLKRTLGADTKFALREADMQSDILTLLGSAVQGFSQERMNHHRHSLGGWLGRHGGARTARAAGLLGMDVLKPQVYGIKIHSELSANFGRYFDIRTTGEKEVELTLRPEVSGSLSMRELLTELEDMNDFLGKRRDRETVKAAIKASPDLHWVRVGDTDHLALTRAARERLLSDPATEARILAQLKDKLLANVQAQIEMLDKRAGNHFNFVLAHAIEVLQPHAGPPGETNANLPEAKATLLRTLARDLAASPDTQQVLATINHAIAHHDVLWQDALHTRDGGSTGTLLAGMRAATQDRLAQLLAMRQQLSASAARYTAPLVRLQARLAQVADGMRLSEFKAALITTFQEDIDALNKRADTLCVPVAGLAGAKADLLNALVDNLAASPDAGRMLARLDQAIADHDALWQGSWRARDGGTTATLLADMRTAVARYAQDPA